MKREELAIDMEVQDDRGQIMVITTFYDGGGGKVRCKWIPANDTRRHTGLFWPDELFPVQKALVSR